jgi:hypothetical protein
MFTTLRYFRSLLPGNMRTCVEPVAIIDPNEAIAVETATRS